MSKNVYVYTINSEGVIREREGIIVSRSDNRVIARVYGGQRVVLGKYADKIHNDAMWSYRPKKHLYATQMLDILVDRRAEYQEKVITTTRRINNIRKYAE